MKLLYLGIGIFIVAVVIVLLKCRNTESKEMVIKESIPQSKGLSKDKIISIIRKFESIPQDTQVTISVSIDGASYSAPVEELYRKFSNVMWMNRYGEQVDPKLFTEPGVIENASLAQINAYMSRIIDDERYVSNLFGSLFSDGTIERVIKRLKVLVQDM